MEFRQATILDLHAQLAGNHLKLPPRVYNRLAVQLAWSDAYAVVKSGQSVPVALAGIAPLPNGAGELWSSFHDAGDGQTMLRLMRFALKALKERIAQYPGGFVSFVSDDNSAGQRMARLLGFEPSDEELLGHRLWRKT